jgi:Tfp pilus assembly protein PilN
MTVRLNLLHEKEEEKLQRQRDPLKVGLQILGGCALLLVIQAAIVQSKRNSIEGQAAALRAEWAEKQPQMETANKEQAESEQIIAAADTLKKRANERFYWGKVIETLIRTVSREVQFTAFDGRLAGEGASITLTGIAAGSEPRQVAEQMRQTLLREFSRNYDLVNASFRSLEPTGAEVTLNNEQWPTVRFEIALTIGGERATPEAPDKASPAP